MLYDPDMLEDKNFTISVQWRFSAELNSFLCSTIIVTTKAMIATIADAATTGTKTTPK